MVENEIQYLSWEKFRRMAPAIVQLETKRMARLMFSTRESPDTHNTLVRVRFELNRFLEGLEQVDRPSLERECGHHLRRAILLLSTCEGDLGENTVDTLNYIGDRLNYVHDRMVLLYE